jgi:hypothetical protein
MLPARPLGTTPRFGFLIEFAQLVLILIGGHEEKYLSGRKRNRLAGSEGIIAKVARLSTETAVSAANWFAVL